MTGVRQGWLVAVREMRERSRSRAFQASLVLLLLIVLASVLVPSWLESQATTKDVGLTGTTPPGLAQAIRAHGRSVDTTVRLHRFERLAAGEQAVRNGDVDVLVVDARRLEWPRRTDEQLRAVVTGAVQLVTVQERAAAAGISPERLLQLVAPVQVHNVELGAVSGRSPDDETAAMVMTLVLFIAIATYGNLVLTGVVEEKASRIVEVLLARMPARNLLAGKVTGIGLLGLAQVAATALVGLVAMTVVDSLDVPAVRVPVLSWLVLWFVLGYAVYATVYGALGSLASRAEDASSLALPVTAVLIAAYWASFLSLGRPDSGVATAVSLFPLTAPLAMPNRIAMGVTGWWEPWLAVLLTLGTILVLVQVGGRVYAGAILHTGPTLRLRDAWQRRTGAPSAP